MNLLLARLAFLQALQVLAKTFKFKPLDGDVGDADGVCCY
jgi:hypothetical protein